MIYSVAIWINGLGLGFTYGTNLFAGYIPDRREDGTTPPLRCLVVIDQTTSPVYYDLPDRVDLAVQFLNRGADKRSAGEDAKRIFNRIHGIGAVDLPEDPEAASGAPYVSMVVEANHAPQYVGQDAKARFQYSTNYIFRARGK